MPAGSTPDGRCVVSCAIRNKHRNAAKYDEKIANTVGADHTDDVGLKQPHKLITVDSDGIGGVSV